jgi:hypothetical protein
MSVFEEIGYLKEVLNELAKPRFNGELGYDEDRIDLLNKAWNTVEKIEKELDHECV